MAIPDISSGLKSKFLELMMEESDIPRQYEEMDDDEFNKTVVKMFVQEENRIYA